MSDVFITYARKDLDFVKGLHASLEARGKSAWVDWEGIPPSAEWLGEIKGAIEETEAFVFVISPYSCSSEICALELAHAREQGKRLIPVLRAEVSASEVDASLRGLNWILLRTADDQDLGVERLVAALETGEISGAGLDVVEPEPLPYDHPPQPRTCLQPALRASRIPISTSLAKRIC